MGAVEPPTREHPLEVKLNGVEKVIVAAHNHGVEAAYYRLRRPDEDKSLPAMRRFTNWRETLEGVLDAVFMEADALHHARTTAAYIRALPRGEVLP